MLHEAFGEFFENRYGMNKFYTDLITLGYAVVGLVFVVFLVRTLFAELIPRHVRCVQLFFFGVLTFGTSQVFDTFDFWIKEGLTALGPRLSAAPGFLFSDLWYPLWGPKQLFNDMEEVLECLAAMLLCAGVLVLLVEKFRPALSKVQVTAYPRMAMSVLTVLVVGSLAASLRTGLSRQIVSPVLDMPATAVVGVEDGLFHSDMLVFHPSWGLLIANEGKGNIVVYRDGDISTLPDLKGLVTDTDSVTATEDAVYVSSPSLRTVFRFTARAGWEPFATEADGLKKPEGLVVIGTTMYVVDELAHCLYAVDMATRKVRKMALDDPRWASPEGIAYHSGLDRLLITDEDSGYVTAVKFGTRSEIFATSDAGLKNPEDLTVTSDGRIFVTDTGRREIVEFAENGTVLSRIRFTRMYGYLVGIAVVEGKRGEKLYVMTSDGFGSESFMPSILWELDLPRK